MSRRYKQTEPITSYGIIAYSRLEDGTLVFLLYQRRDTYEYIEFLRGAWSRKDSLPMMFSLMSQEERERIWNYTFSELWDDLWVSQTIHVYKEGYERARKRFESVKGSIPEILDSTCSYIYEPPWGWPKGKKNGHYENSVHCAMREFEEETRIESSNLRLINPIPYIENFKGTNNVGYTTYYYLCEIQRPIMVNHISTPQCIRKTTISDEASNVRWFTYDEACQKLNPRRQVILKGIVEELEREIKISS